LTFSPSSASAAATDWLNHEHAQVRLVADRDFSGMTETMRLGLQFTLEPGWKVYWRSPGDAGFPPGLDWQGSENLGGVEMRWPVPHRFSILGLESFGYKDRVVLPMLARIERPGEPVRLRGSLTYLACSDICVPHDGELALDLPAGSGAPSAEDGLIGIALARVPGYGAEDGLALESTNLMGSVEKPSLLVVARSTTPFEAPDLLVEGPPGYLFGKPEVDLGEDGTRAELRVATDRGAAAKGVLEGKRLTLTVVDGVRGLDREVVVRFNGAQGVDLLTTSTALVAILGLALLGGLILNLMPCVLPVLSIKLLSVVSHGGQERRAVRFGFLASAAGILFSFLVLAVVALGLKAAGLAAGWGIQFQQPVFLSAMAVIVTIFALNLFDLFEIHLPAWLGGIATGDHPDWSHGLVGHFLTGAFATLLATPCTAPFLGTAVGFALARRPLEILLIFGALGIGLSLPYLAVAALPGLATRLPRPGPWMTVLRRVLGLALAATAVWLLSVLASQVGASAALLVGTILLVMSAMLLLGRGLRRGALIAPVAVLGLAALVAPAGFARTEPTLRVEGPLDEWRTLDEAEIARLVEAGKVVFVEVTADWCITCQVNRTLVVERGEVAVRLSSERVVTMRGDWTLPSDEIADYLATFGRYGIPFNAVYGPGAPEGQALPEILTSDAVLVALEKATDS
jgi:suppressor for copper-sensitivity B